MTDQPIETIEVPDDVSEIDSTPEEQPYRTLLELWRAVLASSEDVRKNDRITPQWASKIVGTYHGVGFKDVQKVHDGIFDASSTFARMLDEIIASDDECLNKVDAKEDAQDNARLYRQVLIDWQVWFVEQEARWDSSHEDAAIQLAILSEVHQMFLGQTGFIGHLDEIGFQYTEGDQEELTRILVDAKRAVLDGEVEGE